MRYPERGEVWLIDLGLTAKIRPCVVLSVRVAEGDRALITVIPHTTSTRQTPYEAILPAKFLKEGAFDAQGLVTVPPVRAVRLLGALSNLQMATIGAAVCKWLGLPSDSGA